MRLLLAGPGTGKTTGVKGIIDAEFANADRILVLSFTNATVADLTDSFKDHDAVACYTLHRYALKINHLIDRYILDSAQEANHLKTLASNLGVSFEWFCSQLNCITFDAMISDCLQFLISNPAYAKEKIGSLDLLIVDEYQDFNPIEAQLVDAIAAYATETIILGDDDQSIYGFKDADPDGIIGLHSRDDVEKLLHENKCYRCPDAVVDAATQLIKQNKNRIDKPWSKTDRAGICEAKQFMTQLESNEFIASTIEKERAANPSTSFLVLNPVRYYVDQFCELLADRKIDFVNFWSVAVEEEDYVRVWWLRAIFSKRRLLNLIFLSRECTPHYKRKLKEILGNAIQKDFDHNEIVKSIAHMYEPALVAHLDNPPSLAEFVEQHPEFEDIVARIDDSDLAQSLDSLLRDINPIKTFDLNSVNIMSIHKSKGLQADMVFINGLVNGVLPNEQKGIDSLEAQRRLLFVGITRALRNLYVLSPVEWDGKYVNRVDKTQFKYSWRKKKYDARTSAFVDEMLQPPMFQ